MAYDVRELVDARENRLVARGLCCFTINDLWADLAYYDDGVEKENCMVYGVGAVYLICIIVINGGV